MAQQTRRVDPKNLFEEVDEGDQITFEGREEPLTVYRHVTEDDLEGQVITMMRVTEENVKTSQWEVENGHHDNDELQVDDMMTGNKTGEEFLIARGPRDGCYLLEQWWSKEGGDWSASVALHRQNREGSEVWTWENTVNLEVVGSTDVDRDEFDAGGDWVRHTEVQDGDVTVWTDVQKGETWTHSEDLTGSEPREPTTEEKPWEILETVSEGDTLTVNGRTGTVTDIDDKYDGNLADGLTLTLETEGGECRVRTYADDVPAKGKAALMLQDEDNEDVTDVEV